MKIGAGIILLILTASIFLFGSLTGLPVYSATEIYPTPTVGAFNTATTPVGFKFNVTFWVKEVSDLFAYQVWMYYDPAIINATRAWRPTWDSEWVFYGKTTVGTAPVLRFDYVQIGDVILVGNTFAGSGKLVIIELQILKAPSKMQELSCTLAINHPNTYLLNYDLNEISTLKTNGAYKYTWSPPTSKPHLAVNPTYVKQPNMSSAFEIQVYIMNLNALWELTNATLSLSFNTTIIDVVGGTANVTIASGWAGPNEVNVIHGVQDRVNITVRHPSVASGNVLIATVRLTTVSHGKTNLTFADYRLCDHVIEIPTATSINGLVNTELVADVAVTDVNPSKTIVGQGSAAYIYVTTANEGESSETFNLTIYGNTSIIQRKLISLSNGSSTTVSFTWNTTGFVKGNYTISVVADTVPGEVDIADNTQTDGVVTIALLGDINGPSLNVPDGKVDIRDIATVAIAFGSYPGQPDWNPNADITGTTGFPDNRIDIRDIAIVVKQFGKIDP